ncbi:hypothetical protein ACAG96_08735 [Candidatus Izemoplasma sp. B36]|uniref:hypothetical protein n=1 Tax=Candidatus Izemoplasma sp. B36 TaxID=3242468 RepID=UPI00355881C9
MSRMKKFIERQKKLTRFQALKSIFSSLLMTVTVVVVATIAIPKSPEAEILDLDIFTNQIVYNVFVKDSDSAIIEDTLIIELENQSELYTYPLQVGENTGVFTELSEDTEYTIRVLADKGFGPEVLDRETFKTYDKTGGAFTNHELLSEPDFFELNYLIGLFINDPFDEYISLQIRYGFKYDYNEEILDYHVIPISKVDTEFFINSVFNENIEVHVYLEAINTNSETVELDYMTFRTPYNLYGSFYLQQVSYNLISVSLYPEYPENVELEYELVLMRNYTEIDRITLEQPSYDEEDFHHHFDASIIFDGLRPSVEYTLILIANYRNPYTLVEETKELYSESITTLEKPRYDIQVLETVEGYEIIISADEPLNSYNSFYYAIYEESEFGDFIYEGQSYSFEYYDNQYHVTFFISKPMLSDYKLEIGFRDSNNFINYSIIHTDQYHEGVE